MDEQWLGDFGDARRAAAVSAFLWRSIQCASANVREVAGTRANEVRFHRVLDSPAVTVAEMAEAAAQQTALATEGCRVLAIQDTTVVTFPDRAEGDGGLGLVTGRQAAGFFVHPVIAVDIESDHLLGLVDAQIWTRGTGEQAPQRRECNSLPVEAKESQRWLDGAQRAAERLDGAQQVIVVSDREGDLYEHMARRPETVDLLVRAKNNRGLDGGGKLFDHARTWPVQDRRRITLPPKRPRGKARSAKLALQFGQVRLATPRSGRVKPAKTPPALTLLVVREESPPREAEAIDWHLLTTLPVHSVEDAWTVVGYYCRRWRIEQVFRALKSDGQDLEATQVREAERLFKLALINLVAAVRTLQLVDARDGGPRPATDVLATQHLQAAAAINTTLEGKTQRQKNPHPPNSLAWVAWIAARLGGWNCYYKPPGPKTMRRGWERLEDRIQGYMTAAHAT